MKYNFKKVERNFKQKYTKRQDAIGIIFIRSARDHKIKIVKILNFVITGCPKMD